MGTVETKILDYVRRRHEQGVLGVTETEIMAAIIPADHPEYRLLPAYRYGIQRLRVRHRLNAASGVREKGKLHYFIGDLPSEELRAFLSIES